MIKKLNIESYNYNTRYNQLNKSKHKKFINEADEDIKTELYNELIDIAENHGLIYKETNVNILGKGTIYITDDVFITITYNTRLTGIKVSIKKTYFDCINSVSTIDSISIALQTAQMVIDSIKTKLP